MTSVDVPDHDDIAFLRKERERIKADLEAKYGTRLAQMKEDQLKAPALTPSQEREKHLEELLSNRTPLRQQLAAAQAEAIEKLVAHAQADLSNSPSKSNEDVQIRLQTLLAMQRTEKRP
jgi:hypothetical protein